MIDLGDWIKSRRYCSTPEQLRQKVENAIVKKLWKSLPSTENIPDWSESDIANYLAEKYRSTIVWNIQRKHWYKCQESSWRRESNYLIGKLIKSELEIIAQKTANRSNNQKKPSYTIGFVNGIAELLKLDLAFKEVPASQGLLGASYFCSK